MYVDANGIAVMEESDMGGNIVSVINAMQSATSNFASARQRKTYVWANQAARLATVGATEGSEGYQLDTKADYRYENAQWRLALPFVEYNSAITALGDGDYSQIGVLNYAAATSTSSVMSSSSGTANSQITLVDPGVYAITMTYEMGTGSVGVTRFGFSDVTGGIAPSVAQVGYNSITDGETRGFVSNPIARFTSSNSIVQFWVSKRTGGAANLTTQVHIARLA